MMGLKRFLNTGILLSLIFCSALLIADKDKNPNVTKTLQPVMSFPPESDEVLLDFPSGFQWDGEDYIYIIDQNQSAIIKYSADGKFIKQIGRHGEGPSEFEMPHEFFYDNKMLFIVDQGNRRVQILDSEGKYLSSFKLFRLIKNIAHFENTIIGQQQYRPYELQDFSLITKYNHEGKILGSFGEPINKTIGISKLPPTASKVMLKIYSNKIYALYWYYPLLQVYSFKDELLKTYKFENKMYKDLISGNYNLQKILAARNYINLRYLFLAFDINDNGMFLCLYKNDIEIHHYNFEGELQNIYIFKHEKGEEFYVRDLRVGDSREGYKFYVLTYLPWPRVRIFISN
jgi:hypothetical protein